MANGKEIVFIRGPIYWPKVLGAPVPNYNKDGNEWAFDLSLTKDGLTQAKAVKVQKKPALNIKNRDDERGDFLSFRQRELRADGEPNNPIRVIDSAGNKWPDDVKIGNGTIADVKFEVRDFGVGKFPGIYPRAIRIIEHVPYETSEFAPLSSDDEYFNRATVLEKQVAKAEESRGGFEDRTATSDDELDDDFPL